MSGLSRQYNPRDGERVFLVSWADAYIAPGTISTFGYVAYESSPYAIFILTQGPVKEKGYERKHHIVLALVIGVSYPF
jgi:hypothetical protein